MSEYQHTGTVYRRSPSGADSQGQQTYTWAAVTGLTGIAARGQPVQGPPVSQETAGREVAGRFFFVFASGQDIRADDGFKITASWLSSLVGKKLLVEGPPQDWGVVGGLQADLVETQEPFG